MEDEMRKSYLFFICIAFTFVPNAWGDNIKAGNKYHIFQYRANIREKPDRNSNVLAILNFGDQVEVVEDTENGEEINDVWGYWCEVKYGRITGYTFGGNLAVGTLITDIDKNGVNDYFCYRFSRAAEYGLLEPSTDIRMYEFMDNQISSVTIPAGITRIESTAFSDNKLTAVTLPSGLISIGDWAFSNNELSAISIPCSVTDIGSDALFLRNNLTTITIGDNVTLEPSIFPRVSKNLNPEEKFYYFYESSGKKAGTYVYQDGAWDIK
jgi:hypothetical protein